MSPVTSVVIPKREAPAPILLSELSVLGGSITTNSRACAASNDVNCSLNISHCSFDSGCLAELCWRLAGPAAERSGEVRRFGEAHQPGDFACADRCVIAHALPDANHPPLVTDLNI